MAEKADEAEKKSLNPPEENGSAAQCDTPDTKLEMMAPKRTASGTSLSNAKAASPDEKAGEATVSLIISDNEQARGTLEPYSTRPSTRLPKSSARVAAPASRRPARPRNGQHASPASRAARRKRLKR